MTWSAGSSLRPGAYAISFRAGAAANATTKARVNPNTNNIEFFWFITNKSCFLYLLSYDMKLDNISNIWNGDSNWSYSLAYKGFGSIYRIKEYIDHYICKLLENM